MPKLQKRPPSDGFTTSSIVEGGIRYESLSQNTRQPIPLAFNYNQATISGGLGTNDSYYPPFQVFSPVSPMDGSDASRGPNAQILAPTTQKQNMDVRKSVELRRLDGSPYKADHGKSVKVATDMHAGANPPAYKRKTSDPVNQTEVAQVVGHRHGHQCGCGNGGACTKCGKHKSTATSATPSRATSQAAPVARRSVPSVVVPTSPTVAGPSAMPAPTHPRSCHKCGKKKKPATVPIQQETFRGAAPPNSAPLPGARFSRPSRPGVTIQQAPKVHGVNPQIDIVPPSASTTARNSAQSPFCQFDDNTPLVTKTQKTDYNLFRNSSLIRSLSRRMSGRSAKDKRASDGPLPSQQLRASQAELGEQGTGRLINMISKAINESGDDKNAQQQYSRLSPQPGTDRPASPFSFQETPNAEPDEFELKEMKEGKGKIASPTSPQSELSLYSPVIIEETLDADVDRRSKSMGQVPQVKVGGLDVPTSPTYGQGSKPPLTRFKSLRRAASVTRSTSLKRLGSLKTMHTAWYRDDMAIEGHDGESVAVF